MITGGNALLAGVAVVFACGVACSGVPNEGSDLQQEAVVSSVSVLTQVWTTMTGSRAPSAYSSRIQIDRSRTGE